MRISTNQSCLWPVFLVSLTCLRCMAPRYTLEIDRRPVGFSIEEAEVVYSVPAVSAAVHVIENQTAIRRNAATQDSRKAVESGLENRLVMALREHHLNWKPAPESVDSVFSRLMESNRALPTDLTPEQKALLDSSSILLVLHDIKYTRKQMSNSDRSTVHPGQTLPSTNENRTSTISLTVSLYNTQTGALLLRANIANSDKGMRVLDNATVSVFQALGL